MIKGQVQYPGQGCIVEFLQGNAVLIAWVLEEQNGKLRLLLPNRRELNLQANRILPWAGPAHPGAKSRDEAIAILLETGQKRIELRQQINSAEIWEMAQGEVERATPTWLAELACANLDIDQLAACGQAFLEDKIHFKFNPPDFEIFSAEQTEARQQAALAHAEREALVEGGAAWFRLLWDARQNNKLELAPDKHLPPEPVQSHLAKMLRDRLLDPDTTEDAALWRQLTKGLPDDPFLALHLAAKWGLVDEHHNFWLDRAAYQAGDAWSANFEPEITSLLKKLNETPGPEVPYPLISIDSAQTRDIDDAFSLAALPGGGYDLRIALAAPVLNWNFDGPLDLEVANRASSLYLPEGNYHMLPECLGLDAYSLRANSLRPALILHIILEPDGSLVEFTPELGWVKLAANLSYSACEQIFDHSAPADNPALPFADMLRLGLELAEKRMALRIQAKAVVIEKPDPEFYLVGSGEETRVFLREQHAAPLAQFLVAELMIAANAGLAEWAASKQLPLLHRIQDIMVPLGFAGCWTRPEDIARVVKIMVPASLEVGPKPHAGMGLKLYTPVSSPLRRYSDFLNEAQVLNFIRHSQPLWTRPQLQKKLTALGPRLDAVGQVQRQRPRYWKFLYLQQQARLQGNACCWQATVCEVNDAFVSISLDQEQMLFRAKRSMFGDKISPGQAIRVRLGKIHPLRGEAVILDWQQDSQEVQP